MKTLLVSCLAATLISTFYPDTLQIFREKAPMPQSAAVMAPAVKAISQTNTARRTPNSIRLAANAHPYSFTFEGQAIWAGRPCPNASIDLRVVSARDEKIQHVNTGVDGRYRLAISLMGSENESITWEINAAAPDLQRVQLEGRQIMMSEPSATIDGSLVFVES